VSARRGEGCAVCGGRDFETIHRQEFLLPGDLLTHYDVIGCLDCGFAFADDLPSPDDYEVYYRNSRKYTYEGSQNGAVNLEAVHRGSFEFVDGFLASHSAPGTRRAARVLDVGCATGQFLSFFAHSGYGAALGLDPAPECLELGRDLYGVTIETAPLSAFHSKDPFDVVLLASVLEHLPDPVTSLAQVAELVAPDGLLFVQVPDAARFGTAMKEPFLEFSVEHVNYFTIESLRRMMGLAAFVEAASRTDDLLYNGTCYPAITSLWRPGTFEARDLPRADLTPLRAYVQRSRERLAEVADRIDTLAATREPVVVWGVGSLTARLLATTNLSHINIVGFVDSNSSLHGRRVLGLPIEPPAVLAGRPVTVLVSSFVYGDAIRRTLVEEMAHGGRIILL